MSITELPSLAALAEKAQPTSSKVSRIDRALETIRKHMGMDVAYLSEFVDGHTVLRAIDAPGYEALASVGTAFPLEVSYCNHVFEGRLPELIPDTSANELAASLPITKAVPIGSHMSLPIRRPDGSIYGMFCCLSPKPNMTLNQRDLDTMQVFADLATEHVHAELLESEEKAQKHKRILDVLEGEKFKPVFQPIWNFAEGTPAGFEALCRFEPEPYRTPDLWFEEAAEVGLGEELELAMISKALAALEHFPTEVYLSINASPSTVISGGLEKIIAGLPQDRLLLEITEHAFVADYQGLVAALAPMRARGLRLAIDDAGAGYASLQHIVRLKPDIIKLDMSLTRDIDTDQALRSLANALIHFSRETGATIVAEGIETEGEYQMLKMLGIYGGQGYHLGRPGDLASALELSGRTSKAKEQAA